ncbi:MAG: L-seryl-tRNA(Sec) selenium transferase [Deltaproteobacteria bacterium]|nr:L-seryl-tRNA(Sec) selenium transferase [Deltaproteobacteria bacterium]
MTESHSHRLRAIPPMQSVLQTHGARALASLLPEVALKQALQQALDRLRAELADGSVVLTDREALLALCDARLADQAAQLRLRPLREVLNATGVILHTNLGRAPLAREVIDHLGDACVGYAALEYDLTTGDRGHRDSVTRSLLCALTGAEDSLVVNNCAAAVLLACTALASGREVIVSRGELVEIGGGFRVPEVIASCGAKLVEVGTTNKTRAEDYRRAITAQSAALMIVHPSNFTVQGFTARPTRESLAAVARESGLPLLEDLGSGALVALDALGVGHEPTVQEAVRGGSDVVMFSGDKLLGGPQAGILLGKSQWIARLRAHPLMRALRPGRLVLAALESTLALYASGRATASVPALARMHRGVADVSQDAENLLAKVQSSLGPRWRACVRPSIARVGGGTLPIAALPSFAVVIESQPESDASVVGLEAALRTAREFPLIGRIDAGALWLDARSLGPGSIEHAAQGLALALVSAHNRSMSGLSMSAQRSLDESADD